MLHTDGPPKRVPSLAAQRRRDSSAAQRRRDALRIPRAAQDTLVLKPIYDLVDHPSAFAAAPDTFPADQFNSGVMVCDPRCPCHSATACNGS